MPKWSQRTSDADIGLMARTLNVHPAVASAMANRNVRSKLAAVRYLCPEMRYLHDPSLFMGIEAAAEIVKSHIGGGLKIAVYGDYDVDGITGTVILYKTLKSLGADVMYYIPHRETEGYGLNAAAAGKLADAGVKLVVTCDNGAASAVEVGLLADAGVKTVVIDHHEPPKTHCNADAMINPKQDGCGYPFKHLCACGLAYKFADYLYGYMGTRNPYHDEFMIFAAIATFCDVVDLQDENRVIAKLGLRLLNEGKCANIGLNALRAVRQLEGKEIGAFETGFLIGPCINATGRLDSADTAVDLFLTDDESEAERLANRLYVLNDERKTLTSNSVELIIEELGKPEWDGQKVLVLFKPEIHESIAGIVAGRVKEIVNKPTVVLTRGLEFAKGSARSIEAYNIFEELSKHTDLFERFGGHAMAAGLTLREENIGELRRRLNEGCALSEEHFRSVVYFDGYLELGDVTFELARQLTLLKPFGKANHEPLFVSTGVTAENIDVIGTNKNVLRFTFAVPAQNGKKRWLKGICFGKIKQYEEQIVGNRDLMMDIVYSVEINEYNGNVNVQLNIKDFTVTADVNR
jgi:single-stranded-DNA-specific exonuclease